MSTRNDGGPAYPGGVNQVYTHIDEGEPTQPGMSLRDAMAIAALTSGEASNWRDNEYRPIKDLSTIENTAICAYEFADAMLAARERS